MGTGNEMLQYDIHIPLQAAGTDRTLFRTFKPEGDWFIETLEIMPDDAVAAAATNFVTVTLTNTTDTQVLQTFDTDTGNTTTVAGTAIPATVTEGTARIISQGDVLEFKKIDTGAGKALGCTASMWLRRRRV